MKAVVQRVSRAEVRVDGNVTGKIEQGLLVLLGITHDDNEEDLAWLIEKIIHLRIFPDLPGKFNRSLLDVSGSILLVSQFTLYGDCRKGRRPSFDKAAAPEQAQTLFDKAIGMIRQKSIHVKTGVFGALMDVDLVNHGPVTFILETPAKKG